ncbi:hypothetical protein CDD80_4974 [Ophiocordyceps camponoti-rufipedis]|uniref:Uncharacterized protein n=1 Tax=Ophiocordyceps camponoti-rufipedis TaxID=2004952 RepID=A0A2C5YVP3_9HYPO|nr:hypothetical protein CDD80_4974 [Ophiocordyceps camponoti-rufipedis]
MEMASPPNRDRQGTLHRYWNIATEPSSLASSPQQVMSLAEYGCEDCGRCTTNANGEMPDMGGAACIVCGKTVCLACSLDRQDIGLLSFKEISLPWCFDVWEHGVSAFDGHRSGK